MHYVIYPDTLFLENFICNFLFLAFMKSLFFPASTWKKILIAGLMSALWNTMVSIVLFRWTGLFQLAVMFPVAGMLIMGCLGVKDWRRSLYLLYRMSLWSMILGGILQTLQYERAFHTWELIFGIASLSAVFLILEKIFYNCKRQSTCMREVVLCWNGRSVRIKGFADTGNQLFDPVSKKPVSVISKEAWEKVIKNERPPRYRLIPYKCVGRSGGLLQAAQIDQMIVFDEFGSTIYEKPMIGITEQAFAGVFSYSILLHNECC